MKKLILNIGIVILQLSCDQSLDDVQRADQASDVLFAEPTSADIESFPMQQKEFYIDSGDDYYIGAIGANYKTKQNVSDYVPVGHQGNDILAPEGSPVVAPVSGTIILLRTDPTVKNGLGIVIRRGQMNFYGAHFASLHENVRLGGYIRAGEPIGTLGHTGVPSGAPHVHFSIYQGEATPQEPFIGYKDHPVDPFTHLIAALDKPIPSYPVEDNLEDGECGGDTVPAQTWRATHYTCDTLLHESCDPAPAYRCVWSARHHRAIAEACVNGNWLVSGTHVLDDATCSACNHSGWQGACQPPH